jgi:hypothetical protein
MDNHALRVTLATAWVNAVQVTAVYRSTCGVTPASEACLNSRPFPRLAGDLLKSLVGVRGFEPPAPASRTQCSTRLSYTPAEARV